MCACFFVLAFDCTCVRIGCTPQLRSRRPDGVAPHTVPIHVTAAEFQLERSFATLLCQTVLSGDRQCCESSRDAELGVGAVCAVWNRLETRGENGSQSPSGTTGKTLC